jgi:hypothetical protein
VYSAKGYCDDYIQDPKGLLLYNNKEPGENSYTRGRLILCARIYYVLYIKHWCCCCCLCYTVFSSVWIHTPAGFLLFPFDLLFIHVWIWDAAVCLCIDSLRREEGLEYTVQGRIFNEIHAVYTSQFFKTFFRQMGLKSIRIRFLLIDILLFFHPGRCIMCVIIDCVTGE